MGLEIKRNKEGLYSVKSSISGDLLHDDKWLTEDEIKKLLIEESFSNFIRNVVEIDMEFPNGYYINNKRKVIFDKHHAGKKFIIENWNKQEVIENKFKEIIDRLNIDL